MSRPDDARAWLKTVKLYVKDASKLDRSVIEETADVLQKLAS
jgi:hypothetical protein